MKQLGRSIQSEHWTDEGGNPTGGETFGRGIVINWQKGPLGRGEDRKEPNGAFVEDVITAAIDRLEFYQASRFACNENADALACLNRALSYLQSRTQDREDRRVEGAHEI